MAALFDVYVVGPGEAGARDLAGLSTALAGRLGVSMAVVSKGLSDKKLCAGRGLDATAAQALVRELRELGAMTMLRPAAAPASDVRPAPPPARPAPPPVRAPAGSRVSVVAPPLDPSGRQNDPFAPPPSGNFDLGTGNAADQFAPPKSSG